MCMILLFVFLLEAVATCQSEYPRGGVADRRRDPREAVSPAELRTRVQSASRIHCRGKKEKPGSTPGVHGDDAQVARQHANTRFSIIQRTAVSDTHAQTRTRPHFAQCRRARRRETS